jgi:hypothetical protein
MTKAQKTIFPPKVSEVFQHSDGAVADVFGWRSFLLFFRQGFSAFITKPRLFKHRIMVAVCWLLKFAVNFFRSNANSIF